MLNKSSYSADLVLLCHLIFVLFAAFGALLYLIDYRFSLLHIPAVIWSSVVNLANWTCPLTPLEQRLRTKAGEESFKGGWIQHYFDPLVRPLGMPRRMELIAGISIVVWNIFVYTMVFWLS